MSSGNPHNHIKPTNTKSSLKRRLSGIFSPDSGAKLSNPETAQLEKSSVLSSVSTEGLEKPSRRFFSFPTYLKKTKMPATPLVAPIKITAPERPIVTAEIKHPKKSASRISIPKAVNETTGPQHAYKISLQKLQQSSRRPLVQVLLIHQTITKATLKLKSEGIHPTQLIREKRLAISRNVDRIGLISRRRSLPIIQRIASPPPPYSSLQDGASDQDDNVPLGLLQREFMKPNSVSVLVV